MKNNLRIEHDQVIAQLIDVDEKDVKTKTDLIRRLIEISRPLLKSGLVKGVNDSNLATYINAKLIENGIKYQRNDKFYNLFLDSEKREYGSNTISPIGRIDHIHNFSGNDEKSCECGDMIMYGKHYTIAPDPIEKKEKIPVMTEKQDKSGKRPYSNPVVEYLQRLAYLNDDYADLLHDQVKKYFKYEPVAAALDDYYKDKDMGKLMIEVKSLEAKLIHADKNSDARQKVGEFEKIKAFILQLTTHTVAHVAKIINITPKHMTNSVIRNLPKYEEILKWFKSVYLICPHCSKQVEWVAYDWFNEQCERMELDMNMTQPILHNNK